LPNNSQAGGLNLVLVARRQQRLEQLAEALRQRYQIEVTVLPTDLASADAARQLADQLDAFDIGLVVSNAGFGWKGDYDLAPALQMTEMLTVNCHTPMLLIHALLPKLRLRGKGGIILTSSVEGLIGCPYSTVYSATKGFLKNLGEGLWGELNPAGIDVLTLCPGATDTEAPASQGIDPATLSNLMSPDEVATLTLENLRNGPVYIPSEHYRAVFDALLTLPKRDALQALASSMKPKT
jgi:uncharacterized protein